MTSNLRRLQPLKTDAHLLCISWHWSASVMTRDHMTRVSRVACGHMTHVTLLISSRHYDHNSLAAIIINHQPLTNISPAVIITVTRQLIVFIEPEIKTSLKKASREGILPADCFIWAVKSPPIQFSGFVSDIWRPGLPWDLVICCIAEARVTRVMKTAASSTRVSQTSGRIFDGLDS